MRTHARTVVIGGGVIGCSILCRLTRLAWRDVVLLERDELTSGSTWHAVANIRRLHDGTDVSRIQHYAMRLQKALEEETGQSCGVFQLGALYMAQTKHADQLRLHVAKAKLQGMNLHEISRDEAERLRPALDMQREMGAAFGLNHGWAHPFRFDAEPPDSAGFTRRPRWESVGREARMFRDRAGIIDISNFAR